MRMLVIIILVFALLVSGCVEQEMPQPVAQPTPAAEEPFSHDLDQALDDLDRLG